MNRFVLLALLIVLSRVHAQDPAASARAIFKKAAQAQGDVPRARIEDVTVRVNGHVHENGETHRIHSAYWHRSRDRAFRIRNRSRTDKEIASERSSLGKKYFEREGKKISHLSKGNVHDRKSIEKIRSDLRNFESVLGLLLLNQLADEDTRFRFHSKTPVSLAEDMPFSAADFLGPDRSTRYWAIDVVRPGERKLRLFIHSEDWTVRKAIIFKEGPQPEPDWVYYLSYKRPHRKVPPGLLVPRGFFAYSKTPKTEKDRKEAWRLKGSISVDLNRGLTDEVFEMKAE